MKRLAFVLLLFLSACASRVPAMHPGPWLKAAWSCDELKCKAVFVAQPFGPGTTKYYRNECVCGYRETK